MAGYVAHGWLLSSYKEHLTIQTVVLIATAFTIDLHSNVTVVALPAILTRAQPRTTQQLT